MSERPDPEATLGAIQSLIERAPDFRRISGSVAAVGGTLSLLAAVALIRIDNAGEMTVAMYLGTWLGVLSVTLLSALRALRREANRRGQSFVSPGMGLALRSMLPPFFCIAALTVFQHRTPTLLPESWVLFYGLGLLTTSAFAPRSILWLGWAFVLAGVGFWVLPWSMLRFFSPFSRGVGYSCLQMAFTFGLFHVVYAMRVSLRRGGQGGDL